ncbi:hypothetical protein SBF1_490040 [Candidatus Desulfosporosinus infrequens]|uniref:Uncharacterized protein n=1 Tax=Candidatus Desulfosporosinus infrequens TaxID=2043169 RepID=A0A2U3LFQ4_9FIRM|nr:hypothetical protein SBF1_490040 [Candidatus Desulfosporosinus infrequens]
MSVRKLFKKALIYLNLSSWTLNCMIFVLNIHNKSEPLIHI